MTLLPEFIFVRMDSTTAVLNFELTGTPDSGEYALFLFPIRNLAMIIAGRRWVECSWGFRFEICG